MSNKIFMVGASKFDISPTEEHLPLPLSFYGTAYEGVKEGQEIHVRALVIDNGITKFLFETFELSAVPNQDYLYNQIGEQFGIPPENMLICATHDHSAPHTYTPGTFNKYRLKEEKDDTVLRWTEYVLKSAVKAVESAIGNMRPAKFGFATDKSYINVNRDELYDDGYWMQGTNFEGCSDKTIAALKFEDYDGQLIGAILNYAVHSITCFGAKDYDGKLKVSCDFPGIASNYLEEYFGNGAVVLWQSGAAGNQNPIRTPTKMYDQNGTMYSIGKKIPGAAFEDAIGIGMRHGIDCLRALKKINCTSSWAPIKAQLTTLYFPGQKFPEDEDPMYNRLLVDNLLVSRGLAKPGDIIEKHLANMIPTGEKVPMKAQLLVLGDIAFYGVACELYNEIGLLCKEASPFRKTIITTHAGAPHAGYILDDASKGKKVFQSYGQVKEGESNRIVVDGMLEMFNNILFA